RPHHRDHHRARRLSSAVQVLNAREFHDATTHTPYSIRTSGHTPDWAAKPFPFKVYPDAPAVELPRTIDPIDVDTVQAIVAEDEAATDFTLERLAARLHLAGGG